MQTDFYQRNSQPYPRRAPAKKPNPEGESPIEEQMDFALTVQWMSDYPNLPMHEPKGSEFRRYEARPGFNKVREFPIGNYRVDFWLQFMFDNCKPINLIVECDGFDWHDRTKDQAWYDRKRDREVTKIAHRILHYSGQEIYRDPQACAADVFDHLNHIRKWW